jgi:putative DNA methylase
MSDTPLPYDFIRNEGQAGRMGSRLISVVAEGKRGRVYLSPAPEHEEAVKKAKPEWKPELELPVNPRDFKTPNYGLRTFGDLFTVRQLVALTTFTDLVGEAMQKVLRDAVISGLSGEEIPLRDDGAGAHAYAEAVGVSLGMAVSKETTSLVTQSRWRAGEGKSAPAFGRQAIPMVWDFAELNPFAGAGGDFFGIIEASVKVLHDSPGNTLGHSSQQDAASQTLSTGKIVSTDPPYYDNIGYADLSDFFYVWLRRSLRTVFPNMFATLAAPKAKELVATPYRHGNKEKAEKFFMDGMTQAMHRLALHAHSGFPLTIYYAFKQSESKGSAGTASTGWETFLAAVIDSGLAIKGTWPISTENKTRLVGMVNNALASSIVLVCQRRDSSAVILARNTFRRELRQCLPEAIKELERANIAPVDVAQAVIGPGIAIFSQAKAVLNPDDSPMSVREALVEINAALDEYLAEDEGSFDADTRFALTFYESYGYSERPYGDAEGLAVARNISVEGVAQAGILSAIGGKAQLLRREQLEDDWDPSEDDRLCVWEATQHLIRSLDSGGEASAAALLNQLKNVPGQGQLAANCRALAYRLYNHCEKTKQTEEARAYNGLVIAWPELQRLAASQASESAVQTSLI